MKNRTLDCLCLFGPIWLSDINLIGFWSWSGLVRSKTSHCFPLIKSHVECFGSLSQMFHCEFILLQSSVKISKSMTQPAGCTDELQ